MNSFFVWFPIAAKKINTNTGTATENAKLYFLASSIRFWIKSQA